MEKKARAVQSAKGAASDSKKAQDVTNGKQWPRNGRRREPSSGNSAASKNEPGRNRPLNKTFDKRPRSRGNFNINAAISGRTEAARLDPYEDAELGSVFVPGSKKQSLNHLLNFVYTPIGGETSCYSDRGQSYHGGKLVTRKHRYNKEHYLQANCQFIVNASGNYKQYINNPDVLVDWDLIEQVNILVSEFPQCPICLYPPVASKMTRCGHIYCWSCILHYLSLTDKTKCPICFESIQQDDLKSVVGILHNTFNIDDTITFKLMKRPKGSLTAYASTATIRNDEQIFYMSENEAKNTYSKLLLANSSEILSIIEREYKELTVQIQENFNCTENCFREQALKLLDKRQQIVLAKIEIEIKNNNLCDNSLNTNYRNIEKNCQNSLSSMSEKLDTSTNNPSKFYYFYQAADGQHIYLHTINVRMLEHTYGSLELSPEILTGKILEKEGGSMTEELRKRLRCLQHLPVTCQFEVAEIYLKPPIVTKETVQMFNEQLNVRRKRRQRRSKDEKKREKRINDEHNRLMGKYPVPNLHIESDVQFPKFESNSKNVSSRENDLECDFISPSSSLSHDSNNVPSFATMLSTAKSKKNNLQPEHVIGTIRDNSSTKFINATGSNMKSTLIKAHNVESDSEEQNLDEYLRSIPPCDRKLGDEIFRALQKAEENDVLVDKADSALGKKKKKKNRQKLLFTTSVAYTGN